MEAFRLAVFLFAILIASQAHAQVTAGSSWENDRGSILTIDTIGADGQFEGEYVNNAAGFGCKGTPYAVVGWLNDNAIGWSVNWKETSEDCKSVTSWSGVILSPTLIETIWSLGYTSSDHGPRVMTGSDYFSRK